MIDIFYVVFGTMYLLLTMVLLLSIGTLLSIRIKGIEKASRSSAKIGIMATHGMLAAGIGLNITNCVMGNSMLSRTVCGVIAIVSIHMYWNIENSFDMKIYRKKLSGKV